MKQTDLERLIAAGEGMLSLSVIDRAAARSLLLGSAMGVPHARHAVEALCGFQADMREDAAMCVFCNGKHHQIVGDALVVLIDPEAGGQCAAALLCEGCAKPWLGDHDGLVLRLCRALGYEASRIIPASAIADAPPGRQ